MSQSFFPAAIFLVSEKAFSVRAINYSGFEQFPRTKQD